MRVKVKLLRRDGVPLPCSKVDNAPPIEGEIVLSFRENGGWSWKVISLVGKEMMGKSSTIAHLWNPEIMAIGPLGMRWMGFERSDRGYEGAAGVVQEWMVEF